MGRKDFTQPAEPTLAAGAISACVSNGSETLVASGAGDRKPMDAAAFRAERRFADTRFGRIAYVERGSGEAALFMHGFPLNGYQWRGALDQLAPYRRCVAPDWLGLGYTQVAAGQSVAPEAQAAMLVELLDELSISTVDIVANDSGGQVAQIFLTRNPERVRTLMLTNCDTEIDSPPAALVPMIEMARAGTFADKVIVPWLSDKDLMRSAEGLGGLCYMHPANPTDEAIEHYLAPLVRNKELTNAYARALAPNPLAGIEADLKRCTVPTRIVWGTGDNIFSSASPDYLDRTLPNSYGVRRVPGAKLFFPEELPDVIAEEARKLWQMAQHPRK